ncbi:nitrate reductase molybdenum cofactor assembly chaperone [Cytobacillus praedii]|uniref:nitrate reductase molybdenum cofactor assembly chaperone n=1 Tax=Cytobacillus praedii TaxID=1742358 RepID=UPI002E240C13|nr:nitrate reductase molybdenum cofactor assembly chaperone [Cytobacillus praedii]MED3554260.1 nitrate reductase molybdenum cofactor assembly chaperone [Cytobacillus praedii]
MSFHEVQQAFQVCSYLLSYPNKEFLESIEELKEDIHFPSFLSIKEELSQFLHKCKQMSPSKLISVYINTFDFGKKSNLYVTYMSNGEQRERGMDLLFLKNYYKIHGFEVTDQELPDYLPIMLEFAGHVDQEIIIPVFSRYLASIKEISENINPEDNHYGHIMKAILLALEVIGISKTVRRSETLCSTSFSG